MAFEYLLVNFRDNRMVRANDVPVGVTNHILILPPGDYVITLEGEALPLIIRTLSWTERLLCVQM